MKRFVLAASLVALSTGAAFAQGVVKLGQLEAQTGPAAAFSYVQVKGVAMAVDEINKAGGFKVGDKTYKFELLAPDSRGNPKEAVIEARKLLEDQGVKYLFGATTSAVYATLLPYAQERNGTFLLFTTASRAHEQIGQPKSDFLIRTWNWVGGDEGTAAQLSKAMISAFSPKKVAILLPNDEGGKVTLPYIEDALKKANVPFASQLFDPATKDFSPQLATLAAGGADVLAPGIGSNVAQVTDIVRQAAEGGYFKKFVSYNGGSLNPGLSNKDLIEGYIFDTPKNFIAAEKTEPKVAAFISAYKAIYKEDFPYSQAPTCASACYDHVYMLVQAMQRAGTVDDVAKVKAEYLKSNYSGLWKITYDKFGEQVFDYDVITIKKGGEILTSTVKVAK